MELFSYEQRCGAEAADCCFWQSDHSYWWYHRPRETGDTLLKPNHILAQCDAEIRGILDLLLLRYGLPTLPSCAGHPLSELYIRSMWNALKRDEEKIRTVGLVLTNCESAEEERWYQRDFKLDFSEQELQWKLFARELGFLGFVLPLDSAKLLVSKLGARMPPLTSIQIWKEISPQVAAVGIENCSPHKAHTWKFIEALLEVFLRHRVEQPTEVT